MQILLAAFLTHLFIQQIFVEFYSVPGDRNRAVNKTYEASAVMGGENSLKHKDKNQDELSHEKRSLKTKKIG